MSELGPREIVQVAYAVPDVEKSAASWSARLGIGPFFVAHHFPIAEAWHLGERAVYDHSAAFCQWGGVMVELIQQHHVEPDSLAEVVRADRYGIHHVTYFAPTLAAEIERLEGTGWPLVLDATTAGGVRFAFHDAREDLGHLIEIYEANDRVAGHYDNVRAQSLAWDGTEPIRALEALANRPASGYDETSA